MSPCRSTSRRSRPGLPLAVAAGIVLAAVAAGRPSCTHHAAQPADAHGARPFGLPYAEPAGLGTWFLGQPYGNTTYAYSERRGLYASGQGLHMGLDLVAACGTPVVSIGDGVVLSVDGRGGSPPHNLMIDHEDGYVSFYGHLLRTPHVTVGERVRRGQPVALTGDMNGNCNGAPHLHLEIRDRTLGRLFNPLALIDADWHSIALLGSRPLLFERDLDSPRTWQWLDDQPAITLGGPLLNDFERAWPVAQP